MGLREWMKPRFQDLAMRQMNHMRSETIEEAEGEVLEVGFGTGLNLSYYGPAVKTLVGLDPMDVTEVESVQARIRGVSFPIERKALALNFSVTLLVNNGSFKVVLLSKGQTKKA